MNSEAQPRKRWTARAETWVAYNWDITAGSLAAAFFAASSLVPKWWKVGKASAWYSPIPLAWIVLVIGSGLFIAAAVSTSRKHAAAAGVRRKLRKSESDRVDMQSQLDEWQLSTLRIMERLCEAFCVALGGGTRERVSIYRYNEEGAFVRLSRYSKNPRFSEGGRVKYPADEGVVGEAWADVEAHRFLTREQCPNDRQWANAMHEASHITKKLLMKMSMKSRTLMAMRIDDAATRAPLAVLVFESTAHKDEMDRALAARGGANADILDEFREIFQRDLGVALSESVAILSRLTIHADPDVALREGF